jgi:hypothetical protein
VLRCALGVGVALLLQPGDERISSRGARGLGGRKRHQERQADRRIEVAEQAQRRRVVVAEATVELVRESHALRHQISVGPDREPQLRRQLALRRQWPEALPIGAQDVGERLRITRIVLGAAGLVTISITIDRLGVDRVHGVPLLHERRDEQPI